ncbi:hypothetical protein MNBD_UNCLBAC01-1255 [hydrothermal vent metagenome]|uniref:DUF5666 domain-containing protein n=1 Tax=hydrothermal vent metagenome TaxID=652676 RepID=A0A3B1DD23_9ZZZZ
MKKLNFKLFVMGLSLLCVPVNSFAEIGKTDETIVEQMDKVVQGKIVAISSEVITVLEKLDEELTISEVEISLSPETVFMGVESLSELKAEDRVAVTYREDEGNKEKIAILITKIVTSSGLDSLLK